MVGYNLRNHLDEILSSNLASIRWAVLGTSNQGRNVLGATFGFGAKRVSLIGGCHADEPVGPELLRHLAAWLSVAPTDSRLLTDFSWWIVPHINPDAEQLNLSWFTAVETKADVGLYLKFVSRELPGDDLEFGFPRSDTDTNARREAMAVYNWWKTDETPFALHMSFHGMGFARGPWFLIDPSWISATQELRTNLEQLVAAKGRNLHDVQRNGDKGFIRIAPGFATCPNSVAMAAYFEQRSDTNTARLLRPSSMETVKKFGGNPLTLVTELPLFMLPDVGVEIGPPDVAAERWRERIGNWQTQLRAGVRQPKEIRSEAINLGLQAMPYVEHQFFQLAFLDEGLKLIAEAEGL